MQYWESLMPQKMGFHEKIRTGGLGGVLVSKPLACQP